MSVESANRWFEMDPDAQLDLSARHGAAVVVVDGLGRVLLQQRDDMTPPEGFGRWAIPGGGAEPGESARMAAIREIAEETALALEAVTYFGSIEVDRPDENPNSTTLVIHLFWARSDAYEQDIVVGEGIAFRFWSPAQVQTLPMNPNGRHWLARFLESEVFATLPARHHPTSIDPDQPLPPGSRGHAGIVFLVRKDGRVLLQQRDDIQPPEGYGRWAFPGGGWEGGETPRDCAHREMREETALDLQEMRYFRSFELGMGTHGFPVVWHVFSSFESVDETRIEVNEGLGFTFWSPEEARELRMNPRDRGVLDAFLASDQYRDGLRFETAGASAAVIELDRWGRVLLQLRDRDLPGQLHPGTWTLPGGAIEPGESPDSAALREFEEETGVLLEKVSLYRTFNRDDISAQSVALQHIYFVDADLDVTMLECNEGLELRYFYPEELSGIDITPWTRPILDEFVVSPAYKRLFH